MAPTLRRPAAAVADLEATPEKRPRLEGALQKALADLKNGLAEKDSYAAQVAAIHAAASSLLNSWDLWIGGKRHRIAECEAYVNSSCHRDPYAHGDEGQGSFGVWYFHRKGGTYKSGSFKGMDLACGDKAAGVHAGLLLRSIIDCETDELVEGPCLVVERILKLNCKDSISAFTAGRSAAELSAVTTHGLYLSKSELSREAALRSSARVGLVLREEVSSLSGASRTHMRGRPAEFCTRPYRFSTVPERLAKFRSGFLAQAYLSGTMRIGGAGNTERMGIPEQHYSRYLKAVKEGKATGKPSSWVDKKISTQPEFCELIGACETVLQSLL